MSIPTSTKTAVAKPVKKPVPNDVTYVQKVIGGDTYLVMAQSQVQLEDEFASLYYTVQNQSNVFLMPPFDPQVLLGFVQSNNVLNQCIEAMEVNIDSTGHKFVATDDVKSEIKKQKDDWTKQQKDKKAEKRKIETDHSNATSKILHQTAQKPLQLDEGNKPIPQPNSKDLPPPPDIVPDEEMPDFGDGIDQEELKKAQEFFREPYPGLTFAKLRRKLRREVESVGYGYIEVLRNLQNEIVGLRNVEPHQTRMVKLDAPILVEKILNRGGAEVKLQIWERQRRFALRVALKQLVYYREFGTARHIDRNTGKWEMKDYPVKPEDRGTELLMFGIHPDVTTPYFIPRWINELPSVLGSRKAEELNLEFLDSGGMPPAIIFIQGGTLAKEASDQLRMYLSGKNKSKNRAVVVEAQSSSGALDSAGSVQVKVERFGGDKMNDAMFTKYDEMTEEHVRVGFRLPPLFLGKAADYNFATAQTAYMVAEEQVFQPERDAFDDMINSTIIREMGFTTIKMESKPITLTSATDQIATLTQAKGVVTNDSWVDEANLVTGLNMVSQEAEPAPAGGMGGAMVPAEHPLAQAAPAMAPIGGGNVLPFNKGVKTATELVSLAQDYLSIKGLTQKRDISTVRKVQALKDVESLTKEERRGFDSLVAAYTYGSADPDLVSIAHEAHKH